MRCGVQHPADPQLRGQDATLSEVAAPAARDTDATPQRLLVPLVNRDGKPAAVVEAAPMARSRQRWVHPLAGVGAQALRRAW